MTEFESNRNAGESWMDEAHRRADTSEESAWTVWNGGTVQPRAELSAAAIVAVISFAWLTSRGAIDVSSNAWQGIMLNDAYPGSVFTQMIRLLLSWSDPTLGVVALNVLTRLMGAITCAGVTAITVNAVRRVATVGEAWICGLAAGLVLVLTQGMTSAFTAAWPGAFTIACAVWGLALISRGVQSRSRCALWLIIGSGLCSAAASSHAFFVWLAVPTICGIAYSLRHQSLGIRGAFATLLTWIVVLALPVLSALLILGEKPQFFLGRILRGPYPAVAERAPDWNMAIQLGSQFHPMVWVLAAAATILFFQRHVRPAAFAALLIFAFTGPLAPFLMNHYDSGAFPRDDRSLEVMALVGLAMMFGLGLAASMQIVFREAHSLGYRAAMAMLVLMIVALHQWNIAPNRRSDLSGAFAQTLLDGCPRRSILIVQDPVVAGTITAAQQAYGHRRDVRIVPIGMLTSPAARQYYQHLHADGIHIDTAYDTQEHAAAWRRERPIVANVFLNADRDSSDRQSALDDLILWEFVRDNFAARPIAFAGVDTEWLHNRSAINGLVQVYPRVDVPLTDSFEAWLALKTTTNLRANDPELAGAFADILLSLSATYRAQNRTEEAIRLAALSTQYQPSDARAYMALARAAARDGNREDAKLFSETGLRIGKGNTVETAATLLEDYEVFDLISTYQSDLDEDTKENDGKQRRQKLAEELWLHGAITVIADFMDEEVAREPVAARNWYELAAAKAQLGEFAAARQYLRDAMTLSPDEVREHLDGDGRFVLLEFDHIPSPHQTSL